MKTYEKKPDLVEAIQVTNANREALLALDGVTEVGNGIFAVAVGLGDRSLAHPREWIVERPGEGLASRALMSNGQFTMIYQEVR